MKKLLVAELVAVGISLAIVILGAIFGWPNEAVGTSAFIIFGIAAFGTVVFTTWAFVFAVALAAALAAALTPSFAAIMVISITGPVVLFASTITITNYFKMRRWTAKRQQVFLSLLITGVVIWAILYYGPKLLRTVM